MILNEKLGVPDGINRQASQLHKKLIDRLDSISIPNYISGDNVIPLFQFDVKFSDLDLKDIPFNLILQYDKDLIDPVLISAGYGSSNSFERYDRKVKMLSILNSSNFNLIIACGDSLTKDQLVKKLKELKTSVIAHELSHLYDYYKNPVRNISARSKYNSYQKLLGSFGLLNDFIFLLYYTHEIENVVRSSEFYQEILDNEVTQEGFVDFFEKSELVEKLRQARDFSMEKLRTELENDDKTKKFIENAINDGYQSIGSISDDVLNLLFINLANVSIENSNNIMQKFVKSESSKSLRTLIFGPSEETLEIAEENMEDIIRGYQKFQDSPKKYFEKLERNINFVGRKMLTKLIKIYAMVSDTKTKNESIINFEAYCKLNKTEKIHITLDFSKFKI